MKSQSTTCFYYYSTISALYLIGPPRSHGSCRCCLLVMPLFWWHAWNSRTDYFRHIPEHLGGPEIKFESAPKNTTDLVLFRLTVSSWGYVSATAPWWQLQEPMASATSDRKWEPVCCWSTASAEPGLFTMNVIYANSMKKIMCIYDIQIHTSI